MSKSEISMQIKHKVSTSRQRAIIVLGMHRSGASAVTRVLSLYGAALPRRILGPSPNNEAGFWEPKKIVEIHRELLESAGSCWDDVSEFPPSWFASDIADIFKRRIVNTLREDFSDAPLFVVKDPRISRLVPFWLSVLKAFDAEPLFVITVRNPLEVAASLKRRNGFSQAKSFLLWLRHFLSAERDTRGLNRSFVRYEDLMDNHHGVMQKIAIDLNLYWPRRSHLTSGELEVYLSARLRHHKISDEQVTARVDVVNWIKTAFEWANKAAKGQPVVEAELDSIYEAVQAADMAFAPAIAASEVKVSKIAARIMKLNAAVANLHSGAIDLDSNKVEGDSHILRLQNEVLKRNDGKSISPIICENTVERNSPANPKEIFSQLSLRELDVFLNTGQQIVLPSTPQPKVSIVIILFNKAELTYKCLRSIEYTASIPMEVIIIDNNSTDKTTELLKRVEGAKVINNDTNRQFLLACNQSLNYVSGEFILFLNNDAQLLPGSLVAAVETLESDLEIGAVGGRIIMLDGKLQEAGSIVWNDGSCLGYGRGDDPFSPSYMFKRDVDYCSGAFLLTRRQLFAELGGFDEAFAPAYYEESDYCFRLRDAAYRIVYEPNAVILHYEFGSASHDTAIALMRRNQQLFAIKHRQRLRQRLQPDPDNILRARYANADIFKVLYIDDRIPHINIGSGFPRANSILWMLTKAGIAVTFFPTERSSESWGMIYADLPRETEIIAGSNVSELESHLRQRQGLYDMIFVSRPHNMKLLRKLHHQSPELFVNSSIIYDAEAIFSIREHIQKRFNGETISEEQKRQELELELSLADIANQIITVSEKEKRHFIEYGYQNVHIFGHALAVKPTSRGFSKRRDILFVGAIYSDQSPNADSVLWFAQDIFPRICKALANELIHFIVIGYNQVKDISDLASDKIKIVGFVDDLTSYFDQVRVFVAPTRFAAGIPHKVHQAAAYGVPVVTTRLIAEQLGWEESKDLLVADDNDAEEFANKCVQLYRDQRLWKSLRQRALKRVQNECSPDVLKNRLHEILSI